MPIRIPAPGPVRIASATGSSTTKASSASASRTASGIPSRRSLRRSVRVAESLIRLLARGSISGDPLTISRSITSWPGLPMPRHLFRAGDGAAGSGFAGIDRLHSEVRDVSNLTAIVRQLQTSRVVVVISTGQRIDYGPARSLQGDPERSVAEEGRACAAARLQRGVQRRSRQHRTVWSARRASAAPPDWRSVTSDISDDPRTSWLAADRQDA